MGFEKPFEHSQELFEAAIDEFVANGYETASINTILTRANMSKGQFYYHFQNKEGLYLAIIEQLIAEKSTFMASVMRPEDFQQDIFTVLQIQIQHGLAFARAYPALNRFADSFVREKGNAIYQQVMAHYNFSDNDAINQLIEAASVRGEFRQDIPLPFIQKMIAYLFTHVTEIVDLNQVDEFEDNLSYLIAFIKSGFAERNDPE